MNVLVVGKKGDSIKALEQDLVSLGHSPIVTYAESEILKILETNTTISMILIDKRLDITGGLEFCQAIKAAKLGRFVYILLLRDKEKGMSVQECLNMGVDDCLALPFSVDVLQVRIQAGQRIIQLNEKLRDANEMMQIDLRSGREAQTSMIPVSFPDIPNLEIAARFIPSEYVSGDIYNIFRLDETQIGLYSIDVSGHGVAAALFSVRLSQRLKSLLYPSGILKVPKDTPPYYFINPPEEVIDILDKDDLLGKYGRYFTMVYAIIHLDKQVVSFYRAGHNLPLLIHADGTSEYLDGGGPPVGLGISFGPKVRQEVQLMDGDEFILFSDGINETFSQSGKNGYGMARVKDILSENHAMPLGESFDALIQDAKQYQGGEGFADDISIIGFKWRES